MFWLASRCWVQEIPGTLVPWCQFVGAEPSLAITAGTPVPPSTRFPAASSAGASPNALNFAASSSTVTNSPGARSSSSSASGLPCTWPSTSAAVSLFIPPGLSASLSRAHARAFPLSLPPSPSRLAPRPSFALLCVSGVIERVPVRVSVQGAPTGGAHRSTRSNRTADPAGRHAGRGQGTSTHAS